MAFRDTSAEDQGEVELLKHEFTVGPEGTLRLLPAQMNFSPQSNNS